MTTMQLDRRTTQRCLLDEQIADEPLLEPLDLAANLVPSPLEDHLLPRRRPLAVAGVVENGLVRPLDPKVSLPEHTRVIIVATEGE